MTHPRSPAAHLAVEPLDPRALPAGGLDAAFGSGGFAFLTGAPINDLAAQSDGSVVAVGSANGDVVVARFTAAGTLDPSFGSGGRRVLDFGGTDTAGGVAVMPDGTVVVVGTTAGGGSSDIAVARLLGDGTDDASFGAGGRRIVDLGGADEARAVALQGNAVVVAGVGGAAQDFAAVRLTAAGDLDTTFNGGGSRLIDFGGADAANAVALDSAGNVVLAGAANGDFGVARLTGTGVLDNSFNGSGRRTIDAGGNDSANGVAVQADGRIVVAGGNGSQLVAYRFLADGTLDAGFGAGGRVGIGPSGGGNDAAAVAVQPDGKIVLAGRTGTGGVAVVRLDSAGGLDTGFGSGGAATFTPTGNDAGTAVRLSTGGRIVVGGSAGGDGVLLRQLGSDAAVGSGSGFAVSGPGSGQAELYRATGTDGQVAAATAIGPFSGLGFVSLRVATADVDGDGTADTILVTGPGAALRAAVVSGATGAFLVAPFDPFNDPSFTGGGFAAAADIDRDGKAEFVITPDQGGGPRVSVFGLGTGGTAQLRANFFGIDDATFRGGARAAVGDVNGDGTPDVVVAAGFGGGPRVAIFRGGSVLAGVPSRLVSDFFAFPGTDAVTLRNGVFVAAGDVTGDGFADLIFGGGPGGGPRVFVLSGAQVSGGNVTGAQAAPVANFFAGDGADRGGIRVAAADANGDGRADVVTGSGEGGPARVRVYLSTALGGTTPAPAQEIAPFGGVIADGGVFVG